MSGEHIGDIPENSSLHPKHHLDDSPKCPKCGSKMAWKYQDKPRCLVCAAEEKPRSMRATRYVYHIHGHAKLHPANSPMSREGADVVPFEVVLRRPFAIDSDVVMEAVRVEVRQHIAGELQKQDSPFIVGDVMLRGVSFLHQILVEADDPEGPAVRTLP